VTRPVRPALIRGTEHVAAKAMLPIMPTSDSFATNGTQPGPSAHCARVSPLKVRETRHSTEGRPGPPRGDRLYWSAGGDHSPFGTERYPEPLLSMLSGVRAESGAPTIAGLGVPATLVAVMVTQNRTDVHPHPTVRLLGR
jgi:hypothetical protein